MKPRILVVDDDPLLCHLLQYQLGDAGYLVTIARNGREALREVERGGQLDLVLLDVVMPDISGWEVYQKLREQSHVPVILLTAGNSAHDIGTKLACGTTEYLSKPFRWSSLSGRIETLLRRGKPKQLVGKQHLIQSYLLGKERSQGTPEPLLATTPRRFPHSFSVSSSPLPWFLYFSTSFVAGSVLLAIVSYLAHSCF